jgi:hypothetical protein
MLAPKAPYAPTAVAFFDEAGCSSPSPTNGIGLKSLKARDMTGDGDLRDDSSKSSHSPVRSPSAGPRSPNQGRNTFDEEPELSRTGFLDALHDSFNPRRWSSRLRRKVRPFSPPTEIQMEVDRVKARLKSLGFHQELGPFIVSPVSRFRRLWDRLMVIAAQCCLQRMLWLKHPMSQCNRRVRCFAAVRDSVHRLLDSVRSVLSHRKVSRGR